DQTRFRILRAGSAKRNPVKPDSCEILSPGSALSPRRKQGVPVYWKRGRDDADCRGSSFSGLLSNSRKEHGSGRDPGNYWDRQLLLNCGRPCSDNSKSNEPDYESRRDI